MKQPISWKFKITGDLSKGNIMVYRFIKVIKTSAYITYDSNVAENH